jgi:hypothetical protein
MGKGTLINGIKTIVNKWQGSVSVIEMECEGNLKLNQTDDGNFDLIDFFYQDEVEVSTYTDNVITDVKTIPYTELSFDLLDEILNELEIYDVSMENAMDSICDEDWD